MTTLSAREAADFCQRFEVPLRQKQFILREKSAVTRIARTLNRKMPDTTSGLYHLLKELSPEGLLYLMGLMKKKSCKKAISLFVTEWRQLRPEIDGNDLAEMGYRTGPLYGTILRRLLDARLDGLVHDRATEEAFIKEHYPLEKQGTQTVTHGHS
jgi:tRNA nucleotidyltransferase (CCA-adding enzyme)